MRLADYLGKQLKSDEMIDLLETHALEVVYHFDHFHEGAPDEYRITDASAGFEMLLDESQKVRTVFCYVSAEGGISAIDPAIVGVPFLHSIAEVEATGRTMECEFSSKEGIEFLGRELSWAKLTFGARAWHYEFENAALRKVTLMEGWSAP
ncbi:MULTISPECIES: hypothetical protein [unclassified Erythrobacter]|uniref:hypothetical protein n=1 Tax=unclassified Erythrobacter TaxID=2633097 RepID=UPI0030C6BC50